MATGRGPRLHRDVLDALISSIISGSIEPGEMLPGEVNLMEEHDVSRGIARETVRALEERGLVSVKHGKGAFVNTPDKWDTAHPDVLRALLNGEERDSVVREGLLCWCWLVEKATELAALRGTTRWISRMREAVASMEGVYASRSHAAGFGEVAMPFYAALFMATENRPFRGMAMGILPLLALMPSQVTDAAFIRERVLPVYRMVPSAIDAGDFQKACEQIKEIFVLEGREQDKSEAAGVQSLSAAA
jgi:GntR family transcriptional repressor for pyruvate dehydrogenase complex